MKRVMTHRLRGKLLVSAAVVFGSAIALLAGAVPAGATQPQASTLATTPKISKISVLFSSTRLAAETCAPFTRTECGWKREWGWVFLTNGVPVGTLNAELVQTIHLNPGSKNWVEDELIDHAVYAGDTAPVIIQMGASCGSPCHAVAHFSGVIADGLSGTVDYTDDIAKDQHHETGTTYTLDWEAPPFVRIGGFNPWHSLKSYRCDTGLSNSNTGCVFPEFTPTLVLPVSKFGAAALMVEHAQKDMSEHWGLEGVGRELTRLADDSKAKENRDKICDRTFKNRGTAIGGPDDKDSCDEFPFAATNQSGASKLGGRGGADCQQVTALRSRDTGTEAEQWSGLRVLRPITPGAPCVRGHIPLKLNSGTGGAYGSFIQRERLINDDKFWVEVVP